MPTTDRHQTRKQNKTACVNAGKGGRKSKLNKKINEEKEQKNSRKSEREK